jgi:hypothetical protein
MNTHASNTPDAKSKAVSHHQAEQQAAKISASPLQEMADNSPVVKKAVQLQKMADNYVAGSPAASGPVIQRKNADALFPFPPTVKVGAEIRLAGGQFEGHAYQVRLMERGTNKGDAIKKIAEFIESSGVGGGSSGNFMTMKNVTRLAKAYGGGKAQIDRAGATRDTVKGGDRDALDQYEPYVVVINCLYASIQGLKSLTLKYNFSLESYGYVTAIIDEDVYSEMFPGGMPRPTAGKENGFNPYLEIMTGKADNKGMDDLHVLNAFDQNHEKTGDRNLMEIIKQHPEYQTDPKNMEALVRHREHFDSIAKFAGEGPRFKCVLNNMDRLSSTTNFVTANTHPDGGFLAVSFEDLAALWRDFGNAYGITNDQVKAKLIELYGVKLLPANKRRIPVNRIAATGGTDIVL